MHDETKKQNLMEALVLTKSLLKQNPTEKQNQPSTVNDQGMNLSEINRWDTYPTPLLPWFS